MVLNYRLVLSHFFQIQPGYGTSSKGLSGLLMVKTSRLRLEASLPKSKECCPTPYSRLDSYLNLYSIQIE